MMNQSRLSAGATLPLFVLVLVASCGCGANQYVGREVSGQTAVSLPGELLDELITVRTVEANAKTGLRDVPRTLFYRRDTGKRVEGIRLVIESAFSEGLAVARQEGGGRLGYVDAAGRVALPFRYFTADPFREGRAVVSVLDRHDKVEYGLIDRGAKWIVPAGRYEELGSFREGRCAFRSGDRWGLLDALGREVVPARFADQPRFSGGLAAVRLEDGDLVYVDPDGRVALKAPDGAVEVGDFHDGLALFAAEGARGGDKLFDAPAERRYGFVSIAGTVAVAPQYVQAGEFSEGLAPVSRNAKVPWQDDGDPMKHAFDPGEKDSWGYIDAAGKVAIDFQFNRAGRFSCRLARVRQNGKWGYIDTTGQLVIPARYEWAGDFRNGLAEVWENGQIVIVDRKGATVVTTGLSAATF